MKEKYRSHCKCGTKIKIVSKDIEYLKITCENCEKVIFLKEGNEDLLSAKTQKHGANKNQDAKQNPDAKYIDHYQVIKKIGQGGMGEAFLAVDKDAGEKVAIKLLKIHNTPDQQSRTLQYFIREAQILVDIDHPNILKYKGCGNHNNQPYLVTEYIAGQDLGKKLKGGPLSLGQAVVIVYHLVCALEYGHNKELIHRDIKPQNIMLTAEKETFPKLIDFGLAKSLGKHYESLTQPGATMGTPLYMPPEQAVDAKTVDYRSDIFSLGKTFYHMIAGKSSLDHIAPQGAKALILGNLKNKHIPLEKVCPNLPPKIYQIVEKSTAFERDRRYGTATEFRKDLEDFFASVKRK